MATKTIGNYARKPKWERRDVNLWCEGQRRTSHSNEPAPFQFPNYPRELYTQEDFLNEKNPSSHLIYNVHYRSNRPLYRYDETLAKNVQIGYERVERVAVALQKAILRHKTTHCFGNPVWFGNEGGKPATDLVADFKSYWNSAGMDNAMISWGNSCFGTGDGAVAVYIEEVDGVKNLKYKVFSYETGDIVAEFINPEDNMQRNVIRMFKENGFETVEIYKSKSVEKWVKADPKDNRFKTWYQKYVQNTRSTDDYLLISDIPHGITTCPVAYHREPDVCWGEVQGNINDIEKLLSDLMENGKYYNFQMLFVSGVVGGLPNVNFQGKVIASRNKDGDAKILQPADASNTFTLSLENAFNMLCDGCGAVFIRPENLKSGDYSGAYLRNLYFPETQWCLEAYARFEPAMRTLMNIFKNFVGILENNSSVYKQLRMSYKLTPFIPSNEQEEVLIINSSLAAGSISRQTATEEHPRAAADETERLEADDKYKAEMELEATKAKTEEEIKINSSLGTTGGQQSSTNPQDGRFPNANN